MEEKITIYSIPVQLWQRTFVLCYNTLVLLNLRSARYYDGLLKQFCALKSTSKKLNQQIKDQFFLEVIYRHKLKRLKPIYSRKKIRYIIKNGNYADYEALILLGNQYKNARESLRYALISNLPLAAKYSNPAFMSSVQKHFWLVDIPTLSKCIILANERADNNAMMLCLWPELMRHNKNVTDVVKKKLNDALKAGRKLNFDNVIGFDAMASSSLSDELLLQLLEDQSPMKLFIPEGKLLHINRIGSKKEFKKGYSNFYKRKNTIIYRDRSTTKHQISINSTINNDSDTSTIVYAYEGVETHNLYELILRTSLFERIFSSYLYPFVAVTDKALSLPLEEQPWFLGNISLERAKAFASGAPSTSIFFTYGYNGDIYFAWTTTTESQLRRTFKQRLVTDDDITTYFPTDKFIIGLYNNGNPIALAEHYVYKYVQQGEFDKLKHHCSVNTINWSLLDSPNLIQEYLVNNPNYYQKKMKKINDDLIVWLIKQGAPLEKTRFGLFKLDKQSASQTIDNAIQKCQVNTIKLIIESVDCTSEILQKLLKKGSYDLLKAGYTKLKQFCNEKYCPNLHVDELLEEIDNGTFKLNTYTNRTLIMMAWKYGNSENYFKSLPLEIVDQILSYEDIDEPAYYDILLFLSKMFGSPVTYGLRSWTPPAVALFLPFLAKYWTQYFFDSYTVLTILRYITESDMKTLTHKRYGPLFRRWFKILLIAVLDADPKFPIGMFPIGTSVAPLVQYCLESHTADALDMLKFLLKYGITTKENLRSTERFYNYHYSDPPAWLAVRSGYLPTIKYLLDEDLLPEQGIEEKTLSDLYVNNPELQHVKEFIEQYREDKKKNT